MKRVLLSMSHLQHRPLPASPPPLRAVGLAESGLAELTDHQPKERPVRHSHPLPNPRYMTSRSFQDLSHTALAADRYGVSNRAAAAIATGYLYDVDELD